MKYIKLLAFFMLTLFAQRVVAQNEGEIEGLLKEGETLLNAGKNEEALVKYKAALALDPVKPESNYDVGISLYRMGKGNDAIPYFESATNKMKDFVDTQFQYASYEMLGSIYSEAKDTDKAIAVLKKGSDRFPDFAGLHSELAMVYYQSGKLTDAESEAVFALRFDKGTGQSSKGLMVYSAVNLANGKSMPALLGFCDYLFNNVSGAYSDVAIKQVENILLSGDPAPLDTFEKFESALKKNMGKALSYAEIGKGGTFYDEYFVKYYKRLIDTPQFPAFCRYVSLRKFAEQNMAWIKEHPEQFQALMAWQMSNRNR